MPNNALVWDAAPRCGLRPTAWPLGAKVTDEAKFNRFSISLKDFERAVEFLAEAKKHQINSIIHEALVFAAIVCYYRPFSPNEKDPQAPAASQLSLSDFSPLSTDELAIHEKCKELRNKALAHAEFKYHPTRLDLETRVISSALFSLVGNAPDLTKLTELAQKLITECHNKRADYVRKARTP